MGLFDKLRGEFIDIIEWTDTTADTIVWKFPRYQNEIKMGAKLTVRESQMALFLNEGTVADLFKPGMYTLQTQNMPILSTLKGWKYGFNSPFKADVYFFNTKQFTNFGWGTQNPLLYKDPEFGPVRLRANGNYSFRISDPTLFYKEIAGSNPEFTTDGITDQLRALVVSRGMDAIAESRIPIFEMTQNYDEVSKIVTDKLKPEFSEIGLELTKFLVLTITVPPEVEAAIDKRASMGIIGNLGAFNQYQAGVSMENASKTDGGGNIMGAGFGAGIGMGMANQMGNAFNQNQQFNSQQGTNMPPPPPITAYFIAVNGQQTGPFNLQQLQGMAQSGQLTRQSLVWKQGMAAWGAADQQADLAALFNAVPPPIQ